MYRTIWILAGLLLLGCPPPVRRDRIDPLALTEWWWHATFVLEKSSVYGPRPVRHETAGAVLFSCAIAPSGRQTERWVFHRIDLDRLFASATVSIDTFAAARWWTVDGQRDLVLWITPKDSIKVILVGHLEGDSLVGWWHQSGDRKAPWARGDFVMRRVQRYRDPRSCVGA